MVKRSQDITLAKQILGKGGLVAIPTETVYGLAANALDERAILKIFKAKNRPAFDPLIAHVGSIEQVKQIASDIPEIAKELMNRFWPGPLTLLLPKKKTVPDILTSGLPSVAIRMPDHPLSLSLLKELDFPLAAPSANPFGYVSPTTADHVAEQLGDKIDLILDGGPTTVGLESTIVSFENEKLIINRLGGLDIEELSEFGEVDIRVNQSSNPTAPGMLKSHYAPGKKVIVGNIPKLIEKFRGKKIGVLSFSDAYPVEELIILSPGGQLDEAAKKLFSALRELDKKDIEVIITEQFPDQGLGRAINDRLMRASADN